MKISLKTKLMLVFIILIFVPLVVLGSLSYKMSSNALQSSTEQQLKNEASQTSDQIDKAIDSVKHSLQIASLNDSIERTAQNSSNMDIDTSFQYIKAVQQNNKDSIEEIIITDATGQVVIDSDTKTSDIDLSDRDYFKKAISGSEAVSDVLKSRFTGNAAIFIAYPLKVGDKVVGTLIGSVKFDNISSYAAKIKVGNNGYAYMVDKNGLVVYDPDKSKILKENLSNTSSKGLKVYVDEMKAGKTSEGFYTYQGVYKYVTFKPAGNWSIAITADYNEYMSPAKVIGINTIIIIVLSIIIAMISAYIFSTKSIVNPIKKLEGMMKRAGDGDLSVSISIKSKDEIKELGDSFNSMIKHQNGIVGSVEAAAQQLNATSEEIAASSEELSATTEHISESVNHVAQETENQNKSIINVSEILVQLSSLVQIAQHKAKAASGNADNTKKAAELGRNKVDETVKAINIISKGTEETANSLEVLNNLSEKVGGIISTINSIAEQTNLLALNAAIEAARAGENGKGFSVVADEVRKLSEETNNNSKEIASLVNEMINQTKNAVTSMERAKTEVCNGVVIVAETDKAFINIIDSVTDIVTNIEEILDITNDEVASSDQIVKLINEMATMTENTSLHSESVFSATTEQVAGLENLAATAEETSAMAQELNNLVEKFTI